MVCVKCKNYLDIGLKCEKCGYENESKLIKICKVFIAPPFIVMIGIILTPMILEELNIYVPSVYLRIVGILVALQFFTNGMLLLHGKCEHFFGRYRKNEIEKYYDRKAIYRYEGTIAIIISLAMLIMLIGVFIDIMIVSFIGLFVFLFTFLIGWLYATITKRFMKTESHIDNLEEKCEDDGG